VAVVLVAVFTTSASYGPCAKSRKITGSIPDVVIGIFHLHNPYGRTAALGPTQTLAEISSRNISWGVKADNA
jgi:hypothetical protein